MKLSIRTKLTLLLSLVYIAVFVFILGAGGSALYLGLRKTINDNLRAELQWASEFYRSEFTALATAQGEQLKFLSNEFSEELHEIYSHKPEFVVFSIETPSRRMIFSDGSIKNIQLLLPKGFLSQPEGISGFWLDEKMYRYCLGRFEWGTLVIGTENQIIYEVWKQLNRILLIGVPLTLLLVLITGHYLSKKVMKPVVEAAQTAADITMKNLDERLPAYSGEDEFGILVQTLNQMIERIEEGVRNIQQFTHDSAHELRTPLTLLRGELELLYQQSELPAQLREPVQKSLDRAIAMSRIVENLLLLMQSDSGKYPVVWETFSLDKLLEEIVEDVRIMAESRGLKIKLDRCDSILFYGDKHLIRRLLWNITENALKFTLSGSIEFSLSRNQNRIDIRIRDSGTGIPEEKLTEIFNRFYRVRNSQANSHHGSGLGLAICKWIVNLHGGEIHVESVVGKGSTFTIKLPLNESLPESTAV